MRVDLSPGDFVHVMGDAHVYSTHVQALEEQLQKQPKPFPVSIPQAEHNLVVRKAAGDSY